MVDCLLLDLPHSGRQTILQLTFWVRWYKSVNFGDQGALTHKIGEPKYTTTELVFRGCCSLECRVYGSGLGFRVQGPGVRVQGSGLRIEGLGV
jgi:hypothetical protein